jgi:chemotaxis response regulator CheB
MRIGIVNDLKVAAEILGRVVHSLPDLSVAWVAHDGRQAVEYTLNDTPDLILMDLLMPEKNGFEATLDIMQRKPCPILIVSAKIDSCMNMVFETMGAGALDVISTPHIGENEKILGAEELLYKIFEIGKLSKKTTSKYHHRVKKSDPSLVAIGASTGGPSALLEILKKIKKPLKGAIVIIQHVDKEFLPGFSKWLHDQSDLQVEVAEHGSYPKNGTVYVANTHQNLLMNEEREFEYFSESKSIHIPSVDLFFLSLTSNWSHPGVAALLTGMGSDGAKGLAALKAKGWQTMVQHEKSCVVFGMPKKALELDPTIKKGSLEEISQLINRHFYE